MNDHGSRNFILITLVVLALANGLSDHRKQKPQPKLTPSWVKLVSFPEIKPRQRLFGDLAEHVANFHVLWTGQGRTEKLAAGAVEPNFFQMIGVEPVLGRAFVNGEDERDHVVMLSHRFWQHHFHGSPAVVERAITLNDEEYHVIGILPADFSWNDRDTDVWMPCRGAGETVVDFEI